MMITSKDNKRLVGLKKKTTSGLNSFLLHNYIVQPLFFKKNKKKKKEIYYIYI